MKNRLEICATKQGAFSAARGLAAASLLFVALVAVPPAPGLTASGNAAPPSVRTTPDHSTLTPAAPVPSKVLPSSEDDIRDIRQPRHVPSPWPWVAAAAGVFVLSAIGFAAWKRFRRQNSCALLPSEVALQDLERARMLMNTDYAREYCFAVSQIIRRYIEAQFGIHAPRLTTEEFLRELVEARETRLTSHCTLLSDFLQHCDLAKFARWRCSLADLEALHASAKTFVQQTVNLPPPGAKNSSPGAVAPPPGKGGWTLPVEFGPEDASAFRPILRAHDSGQNF